MAAPCVVHASGHVELYFYGELADAGRLEVERHLASCAECRQALDDLSLIQSALAARPQVAAPPAGDWAPFMARLEAAVARERAQPVPAFRSGVPWLAMAALLTLVTIGLVLAARTGPAPLDPPDTPGLARVEPAAEATAPPMLAAVGQQHLERSRLVVLGLAGRDADETMPAEWHYERDLASRLLDDTRLYRLAAERDGLAAMADVMRDLEFVLLQASLTEGQERSDLSQIQRAIRKRDLLHKIDLVRTGSRQDGMGVVRTGT